MLQAMDILASCYSVGVAAVMTFAYGHLVLTEYFEKCSIPLWLVIFLGFFYLTRPHRTQEPSRSHI